MDLIFDPPTMSTIIANNFFFLKETAKIFSMLALVTFRHICFDVTATCTFSSQKIEKDMNVRKTIIIY